MKSPRFEQRAIKLASIFTPKNIENTWRNKVRKAIQNHHLRDGVENFDLHINIEVESKNLSQLILSGDYVPQRAQRILVEKSKGLCRQIVLPSPRDCIVLQCLADSLYSSIRGRAPTKKAFFEMDEHRFNVDRTQYGSLAAWLNFQRTLFGFSKNRNYMVITDTANYYDTISYQHLRNVISAIDGVDESVLDMLIFVLSDLLWQPDYTPRIEVGLPQIDLDAPRLLAHCFLYEMDSYLQGAKDIDLDFVRYMDDIDIGVDTLVDAKKFFETSTSCCNRSKFA